MVRPKVSGGTRAVARCDALTLPPFSDSAERLTRTYLSSAYHAAQHQVAEWMVEAGMSVRRDAAINLIGRYEAHAPDAPALVIGSHIDSVRNAGAYDGPLGILLGIEAVAVLSSGGVRMPFAVEVYAFGDEEGSRFPAAMLTSRAVAGTLDPAALDVRDRDGVALAELVDVAAYPSAARAPGSVMAYLEAHIEQGPVLLGKDLALGVDIIVEAANHKGIGRAKAAHFLQQHCVGRVGVNQHHRRLHAADGFPHAMLIGGEMQVEAQFIALARGGRRSGRFHPDIDPEPLAKPFTPRVAQFPVAAVRTRCGWGREDKGQLHLCAWPCGRHGYGSRFAQLITAQKGQFIASPPRRSATVAHRPPLVDRRAGCKATAIGDAVAHIGCVLGGAGGAGDWVNRGHNIAAFT